MEAAKGPIRRLLWWAVGVATMFAGVVWDLTDERTAFALSRCNRLDDIYLEKFKPDCFMASTGVDAALEILRP